MLATRLLWFLMLTLLAALSYLSVQLIWRPISPSAINKDATNSSKDVAQQRIQSTCKRLLQPNYNYYTVPKPLVHDGIFIDDARGYLYCVVPKAACTTWKRVLLKMSVSDKKDSNLTESFERMPRSRIHDRSFTDRLLKRIAHFNWPELKWRLDTYYKFTFVREPLERLLSGYLDQVVRHSTNVLDYIPELKARRRKTRRIDIQFPEFVRIVIDAWRKGRTLDKHWRPQHELCQPCYFAYDFIGHYETLYKDASVVLTRLNSASRNSNVTVVANIFPSNDPDNEDHQRSRKLMERYYSQIPADHIRHLYNLYSVDYEMFGFQRPYDTP